MSQLTNFMKIFFWDESCVFLQSGLDEMFELECIQGPDLGLSSNFAKAHASLSF